MLQKPIRTHSGLIKLDIYILYLLQYNTIGLLSKVIEKTISEDNKQTVLDSYEKQML